MNKYLKPLEEINKTGTTTIMFSWLILLLTFWMGCSFSETHLFPTPAQVYNGFIDLWQKGLVVHIVSSISLCAQAVFISILFSLFFAYSSAIPFFNPVGTFM